MTHLTAIDEDIISMDRVTYVRTEKREGLIRARMLGAELATGQVSAVAY